jgi:hypothetical protein
VHLAAGARSAGQSPSAQAVKRSDIDVEIANNQFTEHSVADIMMKDLSLFAFLVMAAKRKRTIVKEETAIKVGSLPTQLRTIVVPTITQQILHQPLGVGLLQHRAIGLHFSKQEIWLTGMEILLG